MQLSAKRRERNSKHIDTAWVQLAVRATFKALPSARQDELRQLYRLASAQGEIPTELTKQVRAVEKRWAEEDARKQIGDAHSTAVAP